MSNIEKLKIKIKEFQEKGFPIVVLQDPVTKNPSITYTFFIVAGIICLLSTFDSIKLFNKLNFTKTKEFFDMCMWAYLGRSAIKGISTILGNKEQEKSKGE